MSIFDRIKKSMGLKAETRGHVLGGAPSITTAESSSNTSGIVEYESIFTEKSLGLHVIPGESDQCPYVQHVVPGSPADLAGVMIDDKIVALEGNTISSHSDFLSTVVALERPIRIRFLRQNSTSTSTAKVKTSSASVFRMGSSSTTSRFPPVSEEQKEARRQMMAKAALEREKAWDRRVASGRSGKNDKSVDGRPVYDHSAAASLGNSNAETQRVVEAAKRAEQKIVSDMGYNPFKPHMSFSGSGPTAAALAGTESSGSNGAFSSSSGQRLDGLMTSSPASDSSVCDALGQQGDQETDPQVVAAVDEAFAMLMSMAEEEADRAQGALVTAEKMLGNLAKNKIETKFRSIRLLNEAFQTKVAGVPGGLELMLAAGFTLVDEAGPEGGESVAFLRHDMSPAAEQQLDYTLTRIRELL